MTPRRVAGLLLALWWILYPLTPRLPWSLRAAHGALAVGLALCSAALVVRHRRVPLGPAVWATLAAVASLLVATFRRPDVFSSGERWEGAVTGLAHALFFVCVWLLVPSRSADGSSAVDEANSRLARRGLAVVLGLAALVQGMMVWLQSGDVARAGGTLGNPNLFGAFVAAVALAVGAFARWQPFVVALGALFTALLLQTGSRGAFVAGAAVLLAFVARRRLKVAFGVALVVGIVLWTVPNPLTERVAMLDDELTYSRPYLWSVGLRNVAENPLGIGPGMNKYVFPLSAFDPEHPWLVYQRHEVGLTHNVFITLTLEWGWLAGAAGLALAAYTAVRALRGGKIRLGDDRLGQGAALGAAVLLLESQVDGLEQNPLLFSLLLLFVAVVLRRVGRPEPVVVVRGAPLAAALVLAALGLGAAVVDLQRQRIAEDDVDAITRSWREEGLATEAVRAYVADATAEHPESVRMTRTRLAFEVAVLRRETLAPGAPVEARPGAPVWDALVAAQHANPSDPRLLRDAADAALLVFRRSGRDSLAFDRYALLVEGLLRLDPYDVDTLHEFALEAHRADRSALAREQVARLLAIEPDDAFAWWVRALRAEAEQRDSDALDAYRATRQAIFRARVPAGAHNPGLRASVAALLAITDVEAIDRRVSLFEERVRAAQRARVPGASPAEG